MRRGGASFVALVVSWAALPACAQEASDATVAWIKEHAVPLKTAVAGAGFEDLQPLKKIIGDARIVSLGESTHGSREIFQMKHRLVEFLASEMGFTIFSIEANMPESYRLNGYVLGGEGDPDKLIAGMYFWTWNTREVKSMVEWMRAFNASKKGRIEFTGFDMQFPDVAAEEVLRFLKDDKEKWAEAGRAYQKALAVSVSGPRTGIATGTFPVEEARGKKLLFRGWIKTEDVKGFAGLWWRCDGPTETPLAFNNMEGQRISGTTDWKQYSFEMDVPAETTNISFGVILPGSGTAWFDGLEIQLDGKPYAGAARFNLDFEGSDLEAFFTQAAQFDDGVSRTGKRSLRVRPSKASPEETREAVDACRDIHRKLAGARDDLVKTRPAKDVDWAIVNARLVSSAIRLRVGEGARDDEMAYNVEWILQQNPKAKIVLWAHNGHVAKQSMWMGSYLDKKFGKDHVAVAFATARGTYRAVPRNKGWLSDHKLQAPPAESYEAAFQKTGVPLFFLDLRRIDPDAAASGWLAQARPFRSIGALEMTEQFHRQNLPKLFDAVIYIEETTAAKPIRDY